MAKGGGPLATAKRIVFKVGSALLVAIMWREFDHIVDAGDV